MIDTDKFDKRTYNLYGGVNKSTRYHNRRRLFYERWNSLTGALASATLAATAVFQIMSSAASEGAGYSFVVGVAVGIVAIWGAVDTAIGTAKKADLHNQLASEFISLEKRFAIDRSLNDEEYRRVVEDRLSIEAREPPVLYLLNELAHMEFERSVNAETEPAGIPFWRRSLINFASQQDYTIKHFHEQPEEAAKATP